MPDPDNDRLAVAILIGFFVARAFFAFMLGLGIDESYTIAISRRLCPLLFRPSSIASVDHAFRRSRSGRERRRARALCCRSSWRRVGSPIDSRAVCSVARAALIALFALNVTPFFFASAGSWIVPDGPLLFGLAMAAWAASRLFFPEPLDDEASAWRFWLLVGVGLGLAGLSKYSAVLTAGGLAAFVLLSPKQRRWLKHPAPYVSAMRRVRDDNAGHLVERASTAGRHSNFRARAAYPAADCARRSF